MKVKQDTYDVGVIVGRFQVEELHDAHRDLIGTVMAEHAQTIIFLGLAGSGQPTKENPLDFVSRKVMLEAEFPGVTVVYIKDQGDDKRWSQNLDEEVRRLLTGQQNAVLYGGRDSFVEHYFGRLPTRELEPEVWASGTDDRRRVSKRVRGSKDFRAGVIWTTSNQFASVYGTVDIAVLDDEGRVLLGQKPNEPLWRFLGGFKDVSSKSDEEDAAREAYEEAHVEVEDVRYLGSYNIDDWRYRGESDGVRTSFFMAHHKAGDPRPGDDIVLVKWFEIVELTTDHVMSLHHPLLERLQHALSPLAPTPR